MITKSRWRAAVTVAAVAALAMGMAGTVPAMADDGPDPATEQYRPYLHFSPERNWMNDPNGLVYEDGRWHLFFQHNPYGTRWGNMSWGHATSTDLVHWEEQPIAIPQGFDADGRAIEDIFSDDDKVAVRLRFRGTQTGQMGPYPPSEAPSIS